MCIYIIWFIKLVQHWRKTYKKDNIINMGPNNLTHIQAVDPQSQIFFLTKVFPSIRKIAFCHFLLFCLLSVHGHQKKKQNS